MELKKEDLGLVAQKQLHILRGGNQISVATLPDIAAEVLPSKLKVVAMGQNQFALEGPGAEAIDQVALQGPGGPYLAYATTGAGIALVTLPTKPKSKPPSIADVKPGSGKHGALVVISGANFGEDSGKVTIDGVAAPVVCWSPGTIGITVPEKATIGGPLLVEVPSTPPTTAKWNKGDFIVAEGKASGTPSCPKLASAPKSVAAAPAEKVPGPGTYTVQPLVTLTSTSGINRKPLTSLPVDVTDPQGNPLTYTLPESKSDSAAPKGVDSPTTTLTISKKTTVTPSATTAPAPTPTPPGGTN